MRFPSFLLKPWIAHLPRHEEEDQVMKWWSPFHEMMIIGWPYDDQMMMIVTY